MAPLNPTSNKCYTVSYPTESDDDRLNLKVRTGAATCIVHSRIYAHGGLTLGLNIQDITLNNFNNQLKLQLEQLNLNIEDVNWSQYLSKELFELNIVERKWTRLNAYEESSEHPKPRARIFHTIASDDGDIYISGGLVLNDSNQFEPVCDLWKYDASVDQWQCLCDGSPSNKGRFGHSMLFYNTPSSFNLKNHPGLLIVGGRTKNDATVPEFDFFDLVEQKWISDAKKVIPIEDLRILLPNKTEKTQKKMVSTSASDSSIVIHTNSGQYDELASTVIAYTKVEPHSQRGPLVEFPLDFSSSGKRLPITIDNYTKTIPVPYALSYCNIGSFGDHLIVMGFGEKNYHISIFLYHKPSGKWSTLKAFCDHDQFAHKITRGFVWASHHRLLLLGEREMHDTPPSAQYFNLFMTVSLPFVNVSGNSIYYNGGVNPLEQPFSHLQKPQLHHEKSFIEYSRYVAPHIQMTSIKSVFPQYAVTLGRNAFERFGYSMADFEFTSADGDSVPIPSMLCRKRWGRCFEMLIAKGYVRAVDNFEKSTVDHEYFATHEDTKSDTKSDTSSVKEGGDDSSYQEAKDPPPHFRLPFQDQASSATATASADAATSESVRRSSVASSSSNLTASNPDISKPLVQLPQQKPQPLETAPQLPKNKLTQIKTPSSSSSPRGSISGGLQPFSQLERPQKESPRPELSPGRNSRPGSKGSLTQSSVTMRDDSSGTNSRSVGSIANISLVSNKPSTKFVEQQLDINSSKMEPLLLPRAIYLPFTTLTVRALLEFLSTGQVGSKWPIVPTTLDIILISKFYELPLLYDLVLEILYSVIGNKENQIIADAEELSHQYVAHTAHKTDTAAEDITPPSISCLNGFADFLGKFNNGVLDLKILKRISKTRKESVDSGRRKRSQDSGSSASSRLREFSPMPAKHHTQHQPVQQKDEDDEEIEEGDPRYKADIKPADDYVADKAEGSSSDESSSSDGIGVGIGLVSQPVEESESMSKDDIFKKRLSHQQSSVSTGAAESIPLKKPSLSSSSSKINQYDSGNSNTWPTLGQLTAPNAPACTDIILDFIYEIGALAGDMKLMVRAANALDISQKYETEKKEILKMIDLEETSASATPSQTKQQTTLKLSKSLFGKFDIAGNPNNRYEKRGSISSILSNADSNYSSELASMNTGTNTRYPPPPLSTQLSSNALERVNTFDSSKSLSGSNLRAANSTKVETLQQQLKKKQQEQPPPQDELLGETVSPTGTNDSNNSAESKLHPTRSSLKLTGFLKRK